MKKFADNDDNEVVHRYSDHVYKSKIAILGPFPPPLGGVAVHVKRVIKKFIKQSNSVHCFETTCEYRYRFLLVYLARLSVWLLRIRPDIVYYHTTYLSNSLLEIALLALMKIMLRYQLVLVEHDCRHMYKRSKRFKYCFNWSMQYVDTLILIGRITYKSYRENNIIFPKTYSVEGSFLSPDLDEQATIIAAYPSSLFLFLAGHAPCILVNAFQLVLLEDKDLYGIDQCIGMINDLKREYPKIGLIIMLAQIGDAAYLEQLKQQIRTYNLNDHIFIVHGQKELWPLFQHVQLFVRPTLSDSFGISVAEALLFGVPVVASDVCKRPEGTVVYATGNITHFINAVKSALHIHN